MRPVLQTARAVEQRLPGREAGGSLVLVVRVIAWKDDEKIMHVIIIREKCRGVSCNEARWSWDTRRNGRSGLGFFFLMGLECI